MQVLKKVSKTHLCKCLFVYKAPLSTTYAKAPPVCFWSDKMFVRDVVFKQTKAHGGKHNVQLVPWASICFFLFSLDLLLLGKKKL